MLKALPKEIRKFAKAQRHGNDVNYFIKPNEDMVIVASRRLRKQIQEAERDGDNIDSNAYLHGCTGDYIHNWGFEVCDDMLHLFSGNVIGELGPSRYMTDAERNYDPNSRCPYWLWYEDRDVVRDVVKAWGYGDATSSIIRDLMEQGYATITFSHDLSRRLGCGPTFDDPLIVDGQMNLIDPETIPYTIVEDTETYHGAVPLELQLEAA